MATRHTVPHVRLVASGWLGAESAGEIWSCSLKLVPYAPAAAGATGGFFTNWSSIVGGAFSADQINELGNIVQVLGAV